MKPKTPSTSHLALAATLAGVLPSGATPIAIPNPGFEAVQRAEGVDDYNKWAANQDVWRHWYRTENGGPLRMWNPGVDGTAFQGIQSYGFGGNAPEGNMVVHVRSRYADVATVVPPQWDGVNYFSAAAQLLDGSAPTTAAPFDPTKVYRLTATVGKPIVFQNSYAAGDPQNAADPRRPQSAVWHGYALQLAAGGSNQTGATYGGHVDGGVVVAQDSNTVAVPVDGYRTVTTTYFPNPADAALTGQYLQVRLCAMDNPADLAMTGSVVFDDVKLEEFVAPTRAYWDLNDTAAGAGGATPAGTWNAANTAWNAADDGSGAAAAWTAGQTAVFSAGNEATGAYTVTVDGTQSIGGLAFEDGTVTVTGGTALELSGIAMVDVASGSTATVETPVTEASAGLQLAKTGSGTLVLSGANTYTGGTTVLDGTLRLGAGNVLADAAPVTVTGRSTGTANLDLNGNSDTVGGLILGGSAVDTAAVVSTGSGTLTLGGDVAFVNATGNGVNPLGATIGGKLDLGAAARTFLVNDSATAAADLTVSADLSGTVAMTKEGKGTLVLSGNNAAATGGLALTEGVTRFESPAAINGTARDVTVSTPGTVAFGPSFGAGNIAAALAGRITAASDGIVAADNYSATNFDFGAAGLTAAYLGAVGDVSYTGTLTPGGTTYRLGGGGGTLTMANANAVTGGGNSLVVGGKVTLPGANDHGGGTTILGGTVFPAGPVVLAIGNDQSLGTGPLTFQGQPNATTTGFIQSADDTARTIANPLVFAGNVNIGGTGDMSFTDASATNLGATRTFTINNPTATFAQAFGGDTFGLSKAGVGKMILNGNNTYTGLTTVSGGTLVLNGDNSAASGGVTLNGATGVLRLNSATALGTGTLTLSNGTIDASNGPLTLTTNNAVSFGGNFAFGGTNNLTLGSGAIANNGNRTITLNGGGSVLSFGGAMSNNVNGNQTTTVNGPGNTLVIGGYALASANATNRTNVIAGTGNVTIAGPVTNGLSANSGLTVSSTGIVTLTGDNTYTGNTTVNAGATLALAGGSQASAITVKNTAFLGFVPGMTATSTKAVTLETGAKIRIIGTPTVGISYTLLTTSATITGTPELETPIDGFELVLEGGNTLKLKSAGGYLNWAAGFPALTDTNPNLDFEFDGLETGIEYVTGGNPTLNDAAAVAPTAVNNGSGLVFTFRRTDMALADPIATIAVEYGSDLLGWTAAQNGVNGVTIAANDDFYGPGIDQVVVTLPSSLAADGRIFARLKVTITPPVTVLDVDFEANNGGFTFANLGTGTNWEWGTPNSADLGGGGVTTGAGTPPSAKCWGTNLTGAYLAGTDAALRSPVIDLTAAAGATLSFARAIDADATAVPPHTLEVNVIEAATDTVIAQVIPPATDPSTTAAQWQTVGPVALPAAALGKQVRLEWRFKGSGDGSYLGAYIDNVLVTVP